MAEPTPEPCACTLPSCTLVAGFTAGYGPAGNRLYERHLHCACRSHLHPLVDSADRLRAYR